MLNGSDRAHLEQLCVEGFFFFSFFLLFFLIFFSFFARCLSELEILKTRIIDGDAAEAVQKMLENRAKSSAAKAAKL